MADVRVRRLSSSPLIVLLFVSIFAIRKFCFVSSDSLEVCLRYKKHIDLVNWNETFIFSSVWNQRNTYGLFVRPFKANVLHILLLVCGDIERCPGPPPIKCHSCIKAIRKNQTRLICCLCKNVFHAECVHANFNLSSRCSRCKFVPQGNDLSNNIERSVPELGNLLNGRGMKIVHQNIRGLELHKSNLEEIIASYRGIDLIGLSETHMNTNISSDEVYLDGYNLERLDRGCGKGGGVAVYVNHKLPYCRRDDLECKNIECTWIKVLLPKSRGILVGNIYRPPDSSAYLSKNFNDKLTEILSIVLAKNKEVLILGDLNCNFLEPNAQKQVKQIFDMFGLTQVIQRATRVTKD